MRIGNARDSFLLRAIARVNVSRKKIFVAMMDEKFFVAQFSETVASPFLCEHQTNRVQKIDRREHYVAGNYRDRF